MKIYYPTTATPQKTKTNHGRMDSLTSNILLRLVDKFLMKLNNSVQI